MDIARQLRRQTLIRFAVPTGIAFAVLIASYLAFIPFIRQTLIEERKHQIHQMVLTINSLVDNYYSHYQDGLLSEGMAKHIALSTIRNLRYGKEGKDYYWVLDSHGAIISHPYLADFDNDTLLLDSRLTFLSEMAFLANEQGEGYIYYYWQYMDIPSTNEEKVAFIKSFDSWSWILGTGFYVREVEEDIGQVLRRINLSLGGIVSLLMVLLCFLLWKGLRTANAIIIRERALVQSEARFRGMVQNIDHGVIIVENGRLMFINDRMTQILGITHKDTYSINPEKFLPLEERSKYLSILEQIRNSEYLDLKYDITIERSDSTRRLLSCHLTHESKSGRDYVFIIVSDVTERREVEQRLNTLSQTIDQSPESIVITDPKGIIVYTNEGFEATSGFAAREMLGQDLNSYILSTSPDAHEGVSEAIASGGLWRNEIVSRTKAGDILWQSAILFPIMSMDKVIGFALIQTDITHRKMLELELVDAREKAREGERIKTNLLNNISHEVNTPLNAINGFASLIMEELKHEETTYSYIQLVLKSTRVLLKLFNDMIEFSIIESGDIKFKREDIRLTNIIHKIVTRHNTALTTDWEKDVDIIIDRNPDTEKAILRLDRKRLTQIFDKLISNAIKFTHKGNIRIGYSIDPESIVFYIQDTGVGIPESDADIIFERFTHGTSQFVSQHKGTGLGLNITKMLVERMGGKIWFTSALNQGTTFYFSFPSVDVRNYSIGDKFIDSFAHSKVLNNKTILIAEDSEESFYSLKTLLADSNTRLIWVRNGQEAIDTFRQSGKGIDIVLLDIIMPVMDGIVAAAIIRKEFPTTPVLSITTSRSLLHESEASLFCGILIKPFKKAEVLQVMNDSISTKDPV